MDDRLAGLADRLTTRERSQIGRLSPQSLADAWTQFQKDWESAIIYENFLIDLTDQIKARTKLEFINIYAKDGMTVSRSNRYPVTLSMVNWNGYWDSPLVVRPNIQFPTWVDGDAGLTTQAFLERLPKHVDAVADKFVSFISDRGWNVFARLEIPEGCAATSRWCAPLRLIRHYVIDHDVFIARFDMLGGKAESGSG
jgi:hypothetical protein